MTTNQAHFEISTTQAKAISLLAHLLKNNGDKILSGTTKLSLTSSILHILNDGFSHITDDDFEKSFNVQLPAHFTTAVYQDLMCLYDFVQKTVGLKITHGIATLQNNVNITRFRALKILELKKIPAHMIVGLKGLRSRLTTLICSRCLNKLQDIFESCGADRAETTPWSNLTVVILSYNNIEELDQSLNLLPVLEVLDLSHNNIHNTRFLECLGQLRRLNLSYNHLDSLPNLHMDASTQLTTLNLRNNNLEELDGLELLPNLQELDIGYNCLVSHASQLKPLRFLSSLKSLWLDGNPLSFHDKHRLYTLEQLHHEVVTSQFQLDSQCLSTKEVQQLKRSDPLPSIPEQCSSSVVGNFSSGDSGINSQRIDFTESSKSDESVKELPSGNIGKRKRMQKKREVQIEDNNQTEERNDLPQIKQTNGSSLHLQTKEKVEKFRKELGSSWMVASTRLNSSDCPKFVGEAPLPRFTPKSYEIENAMLIKQMEDTLVCEMDQRSEVSRESDEVDSRGTIGDKNTEKCAMRGDFESASIQSEDNADDKDLSPPRNLDSAMSWNNSESAISWNNSESAGQADSCLDDEEDFDDQSFFVKIHCQNKTATLMISVQDNNLTERDAWTGKTLECLDVKSLLSMEKLSNLEFGIHLMFDYIRKDRRERTYTFTDDENCQNFMALLQPFLEMKVLEDVTKGAMQCLGCGSQFSKEEAKRKVQTSKQRLDGEPVMGNKDYLREVCICPNCTCEMIIEMDEVPLPNSSRSPRNGTKRKTKPKFPFQFAKTEDENCVTAKSEDTTPPQSVPKMQHSSISLPSTPVITRRQMSFINRGQNEREIRNELFSSNTSINQRRSKCKSLESSPLSTSPGSAKLSCADIYSPRDEGREESVVKITEESANDSGNISQFSLGNRRNFSGCPSVCETSKEERRVSEITSPSKTYEDNASSKERRFSTPITTQSMRRSESDVTIRTNPSQSSISILSTPSGDQSILSIYESVNETQNDSFSFRTPSPNLTASGLYNARDVFESSSSGSLTASASTAIDKSIYDGGIIAVVKSKESLTSQLNDGASTESIFESVGTVLSSDSLAYQSVEESFSEERGFTEAQSKSEPSIARVGQNEPMSKSETFGEQSSNLLEVAPPSDDVVQSHAVKYFYDNFSQVDHRIRLYVDMSLFEDGELFELILKTSAISAKLSEFVALLIISSKNIYLFKITGEESVEPSKWLQKIDVRPLTQLKSVKLHFGCQGFYFEYNSPNVSNYLFLPRDMDRCNRFLNQFKNLKTTSALVVRDPVESLELALKSTCAPHCEKFGCVDGIDILLYILGSQLSVVKDKTISDAVTLVVTSQCIHVLNENFQSHLRGGGDAFQYLYHQKISDLTGATLIQCTSQVKLNFFDEDSGEEFELHIALETERSVMSLIDAIQKPWKQIFMVDLPIMHH